MDDTRATREVRPRREPASVTLADLTMLVVGFALVFSLPRLHRLADRITIVNIAMPAWVAHLFVAREAAMKAGLILAPVVLARRARYGGLPRPADWSAVLIGLSWLHEFIHRSEWVIRFARWYLVDARSALGYRVPPLLRARYPGSGITFGAVTYFDYEGFPVGFTPGAEWRIWGAFAAALLLATLATLALGRKRLPGWAKTGLLALACLTWLAGVSYLLFPGLARASEAISARTGLHSGVTFQIASDLGSVPEGLFFGVPLVAALFEVRKGAGAARAWTWTGWVGTTAALLALTIGLVIDRYADWVGRSDPDALARLIIQPLWVTAIGLASWAIVKSLGGAGTGPVVP